jgi:hypothetical protein
MAWFEDRGIRLKVEADGRVFPDTDDAGTIVDCLEEAAARAGVKVLTRTPVKSAAVAGAGDGPPAFSIALGDATVLAADRFLLATGGGRGSGGLEMAAALGHSIEPPVPSLFSFHTADPRLAGLAGLSVPDATVALAGSRLKARGPLLVTHEGMSGPAVLRLSAWAARELAGMDYAFTLEVNWIAGNSAGEAADVLGRVRADNPRKHVRSWNPFGVPARLWERLAGAAGIGADTPWTSVSNAALAALAGGLARSSFAVRGKSMNKEEFVTCGGVRLAEVDFRTMRSRVRPGLYLAGEVLDMDGLTGGFNLQAAWTTGWLAGRAMAAQEASTT